MHAKKLIEKKKYYAYPTSFASLNNKNLFILVALNEIYINKLLALHNSLYLGIVHK